MYPKSKSLSKSLFRAFLILIFIRPFISSLAYPTFELLYQNLLILIAILTISISLKTPSSPLRFPITLLLFSYILSTFFSLNLKNSLGEGCKFISYIATFTIVLNANEVQKKTLLKIIVYSATIISLYAIYQYFWGYTHTLNFLKKINPEFLNTSQYAHDILIQRRAIGTFPSPTLFGGYLIIVFFIALNLLFERASTFIPALSEGQPFIFSTNSKNKRLAEVEGFSTSSKNKSAGESRTSGHILKVLPFIAVTFALILTKSMGAWLSLIAALIVFFILIRPHITLILPNYSKRQFNLILIFVFISICLILAFILINRWERLIDLQNPQNSITQRLNYWRTSLAIIKSHPIFGIGPGNFSLAYPKYKIHLSTDTRYAHNNFLHLFAENGLLGLISILFIILTFLKKAKKDTPFHIALFASALTFLFHNLIDNDYLIPEVGLLWWVLLGTVQDQFPSQ